MYSDPAPSDPPKQPSVDVFPSKLMARLPAWTQALALGTTVLLIAAGLDCLLQKPSKSFVSCIDPSSVVAALVATLLSYRMLRYERQRREAIRRRLEVIGEMNHHVRNAIHTIVLSAHFPQNDELVKAINESVQRVDWALKEILPKL